jgi:hypothetical protein
VVGAETLLKLLTNPLALSVEDLAFSFSRIATWNQYACNSGAGFGKGRQINMNICNRYSNIFLRKLSRSASMTYPILITLTLLEVRGPLSIPATGD